MTTPPMIARNTIVLVGLMGSGKTSIGKRLAAALDLPFKDADAEIVLAADMSIPEIFDQMGEAAFRDGERRVIARLLDEAPHVLSTGGGAFLNDATRALIKQKATSVWLKTDLAVLAKRVGRKGDRPLLRGREPMEVLLEQASARYPSYGEADLIVETREGPHQDAVDAVIAALRNHGALTPVEETID